MTLSCSTCKFWDSSTKDPKTNLGYCRFHAPEATNNTAVWPICKGNDWCGQYKPQGKA